MSNNDRLNDWNCPFITLPNELLYTIFTFANGCDIAKLCSVCSYFNAFLLDNPIIWKLAVHNELTQSPLLLLNESYKDYYIRGYLGLYRCVSAVIKPRVIYKFDCEAECAADSWVRYIVEKEYSYGCYLNEQYCNRRRWQSKDSDKVRLCYFLCTAAKHGYEIWARRLCRQGAMLAGVSYINLFGKLQEDLVFCPLYFAIRENNANFVKKLIEIGNYYYPKHPQYVLRVSNFESKCPSFQLALRSVICKTLIFLRREKQLLQLFLNGLNLPKIHQVAINNDVLQVDQLVRSKQEDIDMMDDYEMTPLMYCILLGREEVVQYIYNSHSNVLDGYNLADRICTGLSDLEYGVLNLIRQYDFDCYEAAAYEIFGNEKLFTANGNNDVLQYVLSDLTNKGIFYVACQSAISSRNCHLLHLLISDIPKLLQLYLTSVDDLKRLQRYIKRARRKVISDFGKDLVLDAAQFGQGNCIRELVMRGVQPNMHCAREMLYINAGIALPSYLCITSNAKYKDFCGFLSKLKAHDFEAHDIATSVQYYTFAKAISDLPNYHVAQKTVNRTIAEVFCRVMNCDWCHPLFIDEVLQQRLNCISCTLLEKLMELNQNYDVNARERSFGNRKETALHVAAKLGNPNWVKLLLRAGADRGIKNRNNEISLDCVRRSSNDCIDLLQTYNSCALQAKVAVQCT